MIVVGLKFKLFGVSTIVKNRYDFDHIIVQPEINGSLWRCHTATNFLFYPENWKLFR